MKELIGKIKLKSSNLPRRITVNEVDIFDKRKIANEFNAFFTNIGSKFASKIPNASTTFESYINKPDSINKTKQLSMNELKDAFFSLKINKSPGYDDISFNVLKKCFSSLCEPLKYLFNLSIEKGIFPDDLKIAKVTPIYKADNKSELSNYRLISVLSCFSKILEQIIYNRLYQYLTENEILYPKQLGFQTGHSTEHAIVQLVDQIFESFEYNKYTLGVFIDLSKAFDTVDHSILLKKLELYGVTDPNHSWSKNYLSNRKQFIQINNKENAELETITCGVPQGSILGPLLFLLYVNDLKNASNLLDSIMYADDTNLFLTHKDISYLFETANLQLERINQWFISNKLSLNVSKTKCSFFHKPSKRDDIPLLLPKLNINHSEIERSECLKFLGVLLDENLCWKEHIKYIERKIAKNIGLLYKAKPYINKHSLLSSYHSYIYSYINYENIARGSTTRTNLKKIYSQQKHAIRIVYSKDRLSHIRELFKQCKVFNVYHVNIWKNLVFMHQINSNTVPTIVLNKFKKPTHNYPANFAGTNYSIPAFKSNNSKYRISIRGPNLWKNISTDTEKKQQKTNIFKTVMRNKLLALENELTNF